MRRFVLVENIPEDLSIPYKGTIPLNAGLHELLEQARRFVEIVSPWWALNSSKNEFLIPQAKQGEILFHRLTLLKSR
ncbi:putative inactive phospholipase D5-like [Triplophysa rosa]|uniref:Inactive phospholipase D5-like n=1 Tax=Triplophysa rosa TaxID=992332 RepID=A0A9W7WNE0_TRIRA|nr:putative inactive phospholipase D5-like [Triplophysa rosa]